MKSSSLLTILQDPRKGVDFFCFGATKTPPRNFFLMQKFVAPKSRGAFRRRCCWVLCAVVFHVRYHLERSSSNSNNGTPERGCPVLPPNKKGGKLESEQWITPENERRLNSPLKKWEAFQKEGNYMENSLATTFFEGRAASFRGSTNSCWVKSC